MRRMVLLTGGVLLAGAGLFMSSGAGPNKTQKADAKPVAASIKGDKLVDDPTTADIVADLQLDKLRLEDGHYVAPLKDGRRAVLTLDPDLQKLAGKAAR